MTPAWAPARWCSAAPSRPESAADARGAPQESRSTASRSAPVRRPQAQRRHHHHHPPLGDGAGHPLQPRGGAGRRDGGRLDRVTLRQADADAQSRSFPASRQITLPYPYGMAPEPKLQYLISAEGSQFTDSSRSMAAYLQADAALRRRHPAGDDSRGGEEVGSRRERVLGRAAQGLLRAQRPFRSTTAGCCCDAPASVKPVPDVRRDQRAALKKPEEWRYIGKETMPFVRRPATWSPARRSTAPTSTRRPAC